jgi:acyl-CoA thioester hydrolase
MTGLSNGSKAILEWPHIVTPDEADELGHANNLAYLQWMNAAAVAHSTALGWSTQRYLEQRQGWVVRRHEIEYLHPARPGAELVIRTWVRSLGKASSWRAYEILNRQNIQRFAQGQTLWAWINYDTGRPGRIPQELIEAFPVLGI